MESVPLLAEIFIISCVSPINTYRLQGEMNPNVSGKDSTASISSNQSEGSTSSSDGSDIEGDIDVLEESVMHDDSGLSVVSLKVM